MMDTKRIPNKDSLKKRFVLASDFDQTLSFNDSGYVLGELLGIPRVRVRAQDPRAWPSSTWCSKEASSPTCCCTILSFARCVVNIFTRLASCVRLKPNIDSLYKFLSNEVEGFHFDFYVISAGPVEIIRSALEGIIPPDHIFGTEFEFNESRRDRAH